MASTYLTRTFGSAGNRQSWTWSAWIKKSKIYNSTSSSDREVWFGGYTANNDTDWLEFGTQGDAFFFTTSATASSGNRLMRDPNGWFHAVVTYDGSNLKFYYNNELDFNNTQLSGNRGINVAGVHTIGAIATNQSSRRFNGVMSHVHFVDGAVLAPTVFGETDSVTGEWKIIVEPTVSSYGTNGFFILKDGNSVTDQSGNSNNFTVGGGTLTKTESSPSNVFATLNTLLDVNAKPTLSNGNTTMAGAAISSAQFVGSTICVSSGKWYYEIKVTPNSSSPYVGVIDAQSNLRRNSTYFVHSASGSNDSGYAVNMSGDIYHNNSNSYATNIGSISSGDILGFAIDLDSAQRTCEIYKNGASQRSFNLAEPSSGAYMLACCSSYNTASASVNFGNGFFGTTAISSAGTNASGNGIFEYDVPTGYTALSTKGLNE